MHEEMELVEETGAGGVHLENETGVAKVAPCKNWGCKGRPSDRERGGKTRRSWNWREARALAQNSALKQPGGVVTVLAVDSG